jgi:hypothetical protein
LIAVGLFIIGAVLVWATWYTVQTAGNSGLEPLIFVLGAAQSIQAIPDDRRKR